MLARLDPRSLERLWFPLGDQTKEETLAEAEAAGLTAARRPESQEACFLAGDDYRAFLGRRGLVAQPGGIVDEAGRVSARMTVTGGSPPASGAGWASRLPSRCTRWPPTAVEHGHRRPEKLARPDAGLRPRAPVRSRRPGRGQAPLPLARGRRVGRADRAGFRLRLDEPAFGVARARRQSSTTATWSWAPAGDPLRAG